tara:strand:- start:40 stop:276 length:237 start_codon:yes stop_codon:yes gene_type:complete
MSIDYKWRADVTIELEFYDDRDTQFIKETHEWYSSSRDEEEAWMEFVESKDSEVIDANVSSEQWEHENLVFLGEETNG